MRLLISRTNSKEISYKSEITIEIVFANELHYGCGKTQQYLKCNDDVNYCSKIVKHKASASNTVK